MYICISWLSCGEHFQSRNNVITDYWLNQNDCVTVLDYMTTGGCVFLCVHVCVCVCVYTHTSRVWRTRECYPSSSTIRKQSTGGEGDHRGWDSWMTSPTRWTGVWASSGSWWWAGKPAQHAEVHELTKSRTRLSNWTEQLKKKPTRNNRQIIQRYQGNCWKSGFKSLQ